MNKEILFLFFIAFLFFTILYLIPIAYWIIAKRTGLKVTLKDLLIMRLKRIHLKKMISVLAMAKEGDIDIDLKRMQDHYKSGGDVTNVTIGLIAAKTANIKYSIDEAFADDEQGINIFEKIKDMAQNRK